MDKQSLRASMLAKRRALTPAQRKEASLALLEKMIACPAYREARSLYGYLAYGSELPTLPLLQKALADGKRVAVPKVFGRDMRFIYLDDLSRVAPGYAGIPEPVENSPVAEDKTALVLLPGLAFDPAGHRLGSGGGFYDKFLAREPDHPTLALCCGFQVVERIPAEQHDIPADLVLWV